MSAIPRRGTSSSPFTRRSDERWREYSRRKNAFIQANPGASSKEIEIAARKIAAELKL